jgi:hypothetical protein
MAAEGGERKGGMHRDRATAAAIGALAFAAADMAHEALGHGVAALFTPGITLVSISTVALSTEGASRLVPLAGPLLNAVLGIVCMAAFRRGRGFGPAAFFVWLFATVNLLNAFGYGVYSAVLDFGDLSAAVLGLEHHFAWRIVMLAVGGVGYYASLRIAAGSLARRLADVGVGSSKLSSLTVPAYVAGSTLLLAGAALNPMANLVLLSGVSGGFVCMAGLLALRGMLPKDDLPTPSVLGYARGWHVAFVVVAVFFVLVLGRGIPLHV